MGNETRINTLKENLAHLQVTDITLEKLLESDNSQVEVGITAQGRPFLRTQGMSVYQDSDTLAQVARESMGLLQGQSADLIVFFGLGLGLHLEFLRKGTSAPIIVFEPNPNLIYSVLSQIPLRVDNVQMATSTGHFQDLLHEHMQHPSCHVIAGALPVWTQLQKVEFESFKVILQQASQKVKSDRLTRENFSTEWLHNIAGNLTFLANQNYFDILVQRFAGKPAILVGAGPSLDHSLSELARAKNHMLILAVHSAVIPLSKAGITPDLVIILEGQKLDYYFENVPQLNQMVLIPSPQTHPAHLKLGFKSFLSLSHEGNAAADWMKKAYGKEPLPAGGSVACTAFSVLHKLGCDPLILVGLDNAFTNNRRHTRDNTTGCCSMVHDEPTKTMTVHCEKNLHRARTYRVEQVPGWGDKENVLAPAIFSSFRYWFESAIRSWAADRTVINATEGGARMAGAQESTLTQVLDEYSHAPLPASEEIQAAINDAEDHASAPLIQTVKQELAFIAQAREAAFKVDAAAIPALRKLELGELQTVQPLLDELSQCENDLRAATKTTRLLNTLIGHRAQDLAEVETTGDKVAMTIHSIEQSRRLSKLISEGAEELLILFEPAISKLEKEK